MSEILKFNKGKDTVNMFLEKDYYIVRVDDKFGFRWFRTKDLNNPEIESDKAYELSKKINNGELCGFNYTEKTII